MKLKSFIEELCIVYAWLQAGIYRQPIWRPATVSQVAIEQMRGDSLAVSDYGRREVSSLATSLAKVMCKQK
jgi:hypothetical protein